MPETALGLSLLAGERPNRSKRNPTQVPKQPCHALSQASPPATRNASKRSPARGLPPRRLAPKQVERKPYHGLAPLAGKHPNRSTRNPAQVPKRPLYVRWQAHKKKPCTRRLAPKQVERKPYHGLAPLAGKHPNRSTRNPAQVLEGFRHAG